MSHIKLITIHKQERILLHFYVLECILKHFFNVAIRSKLLQHTPVMGTHSSYQLGCLSRTEGMLLVVKLLNVSDREPLKTHSGLE